MREEGKWRSIGRVERSKENTLSRILDHPNSPSASDLIMFLGSADKLGEKDFYIGLMEPVFKIKPVPQIK